MYDVYIVQVGDSLESIALMFETTEGILKQINGFSDLFVLSPGMMMVVPINKKQPYQYYTVQKGDNMYEIAKNNNIDYNLLLQLNGLDSDDYIYPNQTIMVPKKGIKIYLTQDNDTLNDILKRFKVPVEELLKENDDIYLRPDQIVVFRDK